jgi:hypothetical protein
MDGSVKIASILFFLYLFLNPPDSSAKDLYKWLDDKGRVHYSDATPFTAPHVRINDDLPLLHRQQPPEKIQFPASKKLPQKKVTKRKRSGGKIKKCARLKERLTTIEARLRRGYKEPLGNKLRAQRRAVVSDYREACR